MHVFLKTRRTLFTPKLCYFALDAYISQNYFINLLLDLITLYL